MSTPRRNQNPHRLRRQAESGSRTGVHGVGLAQITQRNGKKTPCFTASCGSRFRSFNILRLGREEAFRRALAARAQFELQWIPGPAPLPRRKRGPVTIEERARMSEVARRRSADPAYLARMRAAVSAAMQRPDTRARQSAAAKLRWARVRAQGGVA